jgi:surfactin synthase thioesterase subunit/MFS family permease
MVPSAFVIVDEIPLNPNGKVDRFALPVPEYGRLDPGTEFTAPRNELEAQIAASWSEVLGIDEISIDDNFFDAGGESFKAIRVVRKISDSVSVMDLFKYPTIRELAGYLSQDQPRHTGLLHELTRPVPADKKRLSLVCIPYGGGNAVVFQPLANAMPENCSLYAVQIPGHDYARRDEVLQSLEQTARQCAEEIEQHTSGPIALYGHCVGGSLALETARQLEARGVQVAGVFMGATFPSPRLPGKLFDLFARITSSDRWTSDRTIYEALQALGGFTDVIDPGERAFVIDSLRHDVREAEDYYTRAYAAPDDEKLRAPVLCIVGQRDRATEFYEERFREWELFSDQVDLAVVEGAGHYFLKHQTHELARIVADQVSVWQGQAVDAPHLEASRPLIAEARPGSRRAKKASAPAMRAAAPSLSVFFLIAFGQLISMIGTGLTSFALNTWVFQETGLVSTFALVFVSTMLPALLLMPVAGVVVDRYDRRSIMIVSDVVAACSTLVVALLLWTGTLEVWHIYATAAVGAIANAFQGPAYDAAVAQLVPKQYLGRANGISQFSFATRRLLAPLLGGVLMMTIGLAGVVLIDFATFLFAITTLLLVRFPNTMFRKREEPPLQEIAGGWRYIARRRGLTAMVVFFTVLNFVLGIMMVLVQPLVLALESPAVLGRVMLAEGLGLLIGGLAMTMWGGTKRRAEGMVGFSIVFGASILVMGLRPSPIYPTIGLFVFGLSGALIDAHWLALMQTKVGLELQGRVLTANRMLALSMMPLAFVLTGPLVDRVFEPLMAQGGALAGRIGWLIGAGPGRGMGLMLILIGAFLTVWSILGYRYRPLRFMEDELPDAIPDTIIITDKDELQRQADRQLLAETA